MNMWVNEEPCLSAATEGGVEQEWELGGTGERETVTLNMYQRQESFCIAAPLFCPSYRGKQGKTDSIELCGDEAVCSLIR